MADAAFSPDEFRELFAEIPAPVRASLRRIFNAALREGVTRQEIEKAYGLLSPDHPVIEASHQLTDLIRTDPRGGS